MSESPSLATYKGNCHCAAVKFTIQTPSLTDHEVVSCNCSICSRNGYLDIFAKREDVTFHSGYDHLVPYVFGNKKFVHKFCPTCGSSVLFDWGDGIAVNVSMSVLHKIDSKVETTTNFQARLLEDFDENTVKIKYDDWKSKQPEYEVGKDIAWDLSPSPTNPDLISYPASCHCGAVAYTIRLPSLETYEVNKCNCSICTKNGYLLIYPSRTDVVFHSGFDHLRSYLFGLKEMPHKFCPTCGSSVLLDYNGTDKSRDMWAMNVSGVTDSQ